MYRSTCRCEQDSKLYLYVLDTLLTVCIIHQLVVVYWRGVWEIFDVLVLPDDRHVSAIICLVIAYVLQALLCVIQPGAHVLYRSQCSKFGRWVLESVTFFVANLIGVTHWRGIWLLLDCHFIPDNPGLSAGITHAVGMIALWLMVCGQSVTVAGCGIDGESPNEEGCLVSNYYIRLFVSDAPAAVRESAITTDLAATDPQIKADTNVDNLQSRF